MNGITAVAEDLERALGDPRGDGPLSRRRVLALDEAEAFPEDGAAALVQWGYPAWLVPEASGGRLRGFDDLILLGRLIARRDLTLAVATGQSLLGALPVWIGGNLAQREQLAARLLRGAAGCLALTEEAHGSDLAGDELSATADGDGWHLDGSKWCINNASRGETLTVLARTDPAGGPRGFSLFLVEKNAVSSGLRAAPRLRTHGIRGADISGAIFERAAVSRDALIGREGHGLDLVLKSLQVSRTLCGAFSLGAADTALRLALDFVLDRKLYGATAWDIPVVRRALLEAFVDLLTAECVALACARALTVLPNQTSVLSAVGKVVVPELAEGVLAACAKVLGARHYLRDGPAALFQKIQRDHAVVPLFDGSTSVNLYVISGQLERLTGARAASGAVDALFATDALAPFQPSALQTSNRGADDLLGSLDSLGGDLAATLVFERDRAAKNAMALAERDLRQDTPERFAAARRYATLVAAACCLHQAASPGDLPVAWTTAAVRRLLGLPTADVTPLEPMLLDLHRRGRLFSRSPIQLAEGAV